MTERNPQKQVRELLRRVLDDPAVLAKMSTAELDLALRVARRERLLAALALRLQQAGAYESLPVVARDQLKSAMVLAESRARLALWELDRIAAAFAGAESVTLIAMKGCAYLLLGLPFANGRIFADVDLMLAESALGNAEKRLNENGWQSQKLTPYDQNYYRKWTHELPPLVHVEREVEIDLHHNVLPRTARLKPDPDKLLDRVREVPGSRFRVLAAEDMVLHTITHLTFNDDMADKLRELVDIDELLRHFAAEDPEFWNRLLARAEDLDLRRAAYYGLRYARELVGTPIPDTAFGAMRGWGPSGPVRWLMDRLVARALYPPHPDFPSRLTAFSRLLLYMRSHWIRMPPWLLVYHLGYKFFARRLGKRGST